jgi:hypothetical protein
MKWITKDILDEAVAIQHNLPFLIHGDTERNSLKAYPTHTHGLCKIGIPELFINHSAFGPTDNAILINMIAMSFMLRPHILEKFKEDKIRVASSGAFEKDDPVICLRMVEHDFLGVIKAYVNDRNSSTGYAQLYVKGDDHVLKDEYFEGIP